MKKKLEAELISIAHRILKLKNRAELDVLQQETLKLYEKISVLRFVEDNFNDVKPTIGYASAEETLEEIYGIEETPVVHANEQEAEEEEKRAQAKSQKAQADEPKDDKSQDKEPQATSEEQSSEEKEEEAEGDTDPEQPVEEYQASEEEKEHTEEETDEDVEEEEPKAEEEPQANSQQPQDEDSEKDATRNLKPETVNNEQQTTNNDQQTENSEAAPEVKVQVEKPAEDVKAMEAGAAAVYKKEDNSTLEEEEQAADAEVITIAPDDKAKVEEADLNFEFAFERKPAPEESQKQKEITFEDYKDYKEPEFVKKGDEPQSTSSQSQSQSQQETRNAQPETSNAARDWRDWEPAKEEVKPQAISQQPQAASIQSQSQSAESTRNPQRETRSLTLGLNDRIAFEKNLFGGSGEDLNRVISQLNTFDSFDEAKEFIADMVKPDYNNWQGKEEYEERFMALVEKKFD